MYRIQYLPAHEKDQVQDIRNWVQNDPESTTRSAPESLVIGLIENSAATTCQETGTSGTSKESAPEAKKSSPFVANTGDGVAGRSKNPIVRVPSSPYLSLLKRN